jgi:hypothetical protein
MSQLTKISRRLTEENVEHQNDQRTPTNDQSGKPTVTVTGAGGVQASHYFRYVMNCFTVRGKIG